MPHEMSCHVYILTNFTNTVLYTGVTSKLKDRVRKHREKANPNAFTSRYNVWKLVYFEAFGEIRAAIEREKQIKAGPRRRKVELVEKVNPEWRDLYRELED